MDDTILKGIQKRKILANYIASNSGSLITDLYRGKIRVEEKSTNDYATELDKSIESMATKSILEQFPGDGFFGEENINIESKNGFEWVVDPIDGTNNYVRGLPLCGFQLAILHKGVPIFSLIHRPLTQEIYTATKGQGAHYTNNLTGKHAALKVSSRRLNEAIGIFDARVGKSNDKSTELMLRLSDHINMTRVFGTAVFDLPAIAEGSAEFLISAVAKKYDIVAGLLLIEESGGAAYGINGQDIQQTDELVIFSSPSLKDDILQTIKP